MNTKTKVYLIIIIANIVYALLEITPFFEKLRYENALIRKADVLGYCLLSFVIVFIMGLELRHKSDNIKISLALAGSFLLVTAIKMWTLIKIL